MAIKLEKMMEEAKGLRAFLKRGNISDTQRKKATQDLRRLVRDMRAAEGNAPAKTRSKPGEIKKQADVKKGAKENAKRKVNRVAADKPARPSGEKPAPKAAPKKRGQTISSARAESKAVKAERKNVRAEGGKSTRKPALAKREASKPKPQPKPTVKESAEALKKRGLGKKPLGSADATRRKQAQTLRARTLSGGEKAPTVAQKSGRKVLGTLLKGFSKVAGIAGVAVTAYDMYAAKQKVNTSVKQYEAKAREIAKASAALKAPPKRGTNVMIAGQKVKLPSTTLKALKTVNVKSRVMDNPAKAIEAAPTAQKAAPKDELTFGQAFNKARRERIKSGADMNKATFTWKGKKYHTRTKEEEAKAKKKPMKVGKPGYNRRKVK